MLYKDKLMNQVSSAVSICTIHLIRPQLGPNQGGLNKGLLLSRVSKLKIHSVHQCKTNYCR